MIQADCIECQHFEKCYPIGAYVEQQLDGEIARDLCVNNDKCKWEQKE